MKKLFKFLLALSILVILSIFIIGSLATATFIINNIIYGWTITILITFIIACVFVNVCIKKLIYKKLKSFNFESLSSKSLVIIYHTVSGLFMIGIILMFIMTSMFTGVEETYYKNSHCDLESLSQVEKCKGYGIFGWQNAIDYDIRAYGNADKQLCQKYQNTNFSNSLIPPMNRTENVETAFNIHENHDCNINEPAKAWRPVQCNFFEYPEITNCYACARGLSNGNGHRFGLIAFSNDCQAGTYVFLADWQTDLIQKIPTLIPLEEQKEPPKILIENTRTKN